MIDKVHKSIKIMPYMLNAWKNNTINITESPNETANVILEWISSSAHPFRA